MTGPKQSADAVITVDVKKKYILRTNEHSLANTKQTLKLRTSD